ncbi:N-acetyltransferase [Erysipelotrichaceae bacterium]|nr:N-acetyltransferase [Erysipelotrichaceae bacterium]
MENYQAVALAQNQFLETERLILRPVVLTDADALYAYASDAETIKYLSFEKHESIDESYQAIASYFLASPLGKYALVLKEDKTMIGTIDLRLDVGYIAEIGYVLNPKFSGRGYMSEAAKRIVKLGFEQCNCKKIYSKYDVSNGKSGKVMERIGMKPEGILRASFELKGKLSDIAYYGILKKEYDAL